MPSVSCPACGEDERLTGEAVDDAIALRCQACDHVWDRDTRPVCGACGSANVEGVPTSTLKEAGRAGVETPSGIRLVYYCWACQSDDVCSSAPLAGPQPPPGRSRDVRALRARNR